MEDFIKLVNNMKVHVSKLYFGKVSVRSYVVVRCIQRKENLIIVHDDKQMTLTPKQLKLGVSDGIEHVSQYNGSYSLIDYVWNPDPVKEVPAHPDLQHSIPVETKLKLSELWKEVLAKKQQQKI